MSMVTTLVEILRILLRITRPYSLKFMDIVYRLIFGPKPELPPINDRILLMPAVALAEKIRKRQLKSEHVVKAYINRIKEVDPLINACEDHRFEDALKEAKEVDSFISSGSKTEEEIEKEKPLLGVPFTSKEALGVKGLARSLGRSKLKDCKAEKDGACPALYRKAGAIALAVTHVSEYCYWWETVHAFGWTFNPYDNVRSVGGSSGGQAAMLAYAGAVMGVGHDLAGSIRVPSAFNCVYAHKSSPGMISNEGHLPLGPERLMAYIAPGPQCRYAKDLPLLLSVLSEGRIKFDKKVDFRKVKIYYMEQFPGYLLEPIPDIKAAVRKAAQHFEDTYDNKPTKINIPDLKYTTEIFNSKLLELGLPSARIVLEEDGPINLFLEFIKVIFRRSEHTLPILFNAASGNLKKDSKYYKFLAMFEAIKKKLDSVLDGDSILLIPTHPEPAVHHLMSIPKLPNKAYTSIINFFGYPATQVPAGLSDGLPIGIQILGMINNDNLCISVAMELEKVFGGWISPSKINV